MSSLARSNATNRTRRPMITRLRIPIGQDSGNHESVESVASSIRQGSFNPNNTSGGQPLEGARPSRATAQMANGGRPLGIITGDKLTLEGSDNGRTIPGGRRSNSNSTDIAEGDSASYLDIKAENITLGARLGEGSMGTVYKAIYKPTQLVMAVKTISVDPDPAIYRQIIRERSTLRSCQSPYIVSYYGTFFDHDQSSLAMCMEYCVGGSLDAIYKRILERQRRIGEGVLGKIAESVLQALVYLHDHKVIHRDVKPSNILVTAQGEIKLCDFGVSGELVDSIARTFVGTSHYMAPERIQGAGYAVQSDVWSLGVTLVEVAQNRFPFPPPGHPPLAFIELVDYIVRMPPPELHEADGWSPECCHFVAVCLTKEANRRPSPREMLLHPFVERTKGVFLDLHRWIAEVWA
ncbi:Protein kinase C signaling pathway involved MAPKK protein [Dispira simplex]|nr:Protein kinase C signaling pathway involved MAPKK protein [Dispira simplex]